MLQLGGWREDIAQAGRRLRRSPLFTLTATAMLALGIGANGAVFSVVDAVVFRPAPYERPEEIVSVWQDSDEGAPSSSAFPAYRDISELTQVFSGVAATSPDEAIWELPDGPRRASVTYSTSSYFPVLGLTPSIGGWFSLEQDVVGGGAYAVVSHRTWRLVLGGDPAVVGSYVRLNGQTVTVVGVGPENFNGPLGTPTTDFWLSISSTSVGGDFRVANLERREDHWYDIVARLAPGISIEQARAATDALAVRMGELNPELDRGRGLTVFASNEIRINPEADGILLPVGVGLFSVSGLVLILACSNLANLILVRGLARSPEMTVRRALGAGRGRIARLFMIEGMMLALLGGVAALFVASWAVELFPRIPTPLPGAAGLDVGMDGRVVFFGGVLAVASGLVFGALPTLRAWHDNLAGGLREDLRAVSAGRRSSLLRSSLVGVQVAASLILMVGAGLFARSLANVRQVDPGVDAERLAVLGVDVARGAPSPEAAALRFQELLSLIEVQPGVTGVALATRLPAQPGGSTTTIIEGFVPEAGTGAVELPFAFVSPGFFRTAGIELLAGRDFSAEDRPEQPRAVVVNETAAQRFWGGEAVGKRMRAQGNNTAWREVVGVVSDAKVASLDEPPTPMIYFSMGQVPQACCFVVARTDGDAESLLAGMRAALAEVGPDIPPTRLDTFDQIVGEGFATSRVAATLMGSFAALALVLAGLGIYAVVSFAVTHRATEIGIRVALGATRPRVAAMVLKDSLASSGAGLAAGLTVALILAPRLEGLLFEVGATDPITFAAAASFLLAVAFLASWLPAYRAARADPADVLRAR